MPHFSNKSKARLESCDPELQRLFNEVIKHRDCTILEGHRGRERQDRFFAEGKSKLKYPMSKHNMIPSRAVDVAPWPLDWDDKAGFDAFGHFVLGVAATLGIDIRWGGNFKSFYDGPHFELKND